MKHPTPEDWMDFLYEEIDPTKRNNLASHLRACSSCQDSVNGWRKGMSSLDAWQLPASHSWRSRGWSPWLKWAAVAMVCATAGFAAARIGGRFDAVAIRASIALDLKEQIAGQMQSELRAAVGSARTQISQELRQAQQDGFITLGKAQAETQQLLGELARTSSENRMEDQKALLAELTRMERERLSDLQTLRKELETVAVLTEDSLQKAQNQIVRLASFNENSPASNPTP